MQDRGTFTVSIDLELAWGVCERDIRESMRRKLELEREIVQRILGLFSKYQISATWAVVGHLLSPECRWASGRVHPEICRPIVKGSKQDWFFQHPKERGHRLWYGGDLVKLIRDASPDQEIGSHSFCHIPFDEEATNPDAVAADIEMAKRAHDALDLPFRTFVFPRELVGYRELLAKAGICVYRGRDDRWFYSVPRWLDSMPFGPFHRVLRFISFLVPVAPRTVRAQVDDVGMVNVPGSMLLIGRGGLRRLIPSRNLINMGVAGLTRAVQRKEIFHLVFHPSNFADRMQEQLRVLESILETAQRLRLENRLEVLPMGAFDTGIGRPWRTLDSVITAEKAVSTP